MTIADPRSGQLTVERPSGDRPAPKTRRRRGRWVLSGPLLLVLAFLILVPAAFVVVAAFTTNTPRPGSSLGSFTFGHFAILGEGTFVSGLINSFVIGLCGTVLALLIGGSLAFLAARSNVPLRRFVFVVGLMPLFLPSYVGALAWSMMGSPRAGLLNIAFRDLGLPFSVDLYSMGGTIFVLALFYAPYPFLMIHSAMSMMNPDLEDAAAIHGGSALRMLREVTFPLAMPAILGSGLLVFVLILENFPVAQVLATPGDVETLPTFLYQLMNDSPVRGNEASAIAIVLVAIVAAVTLLQRRALAKRSYTTVSGKGVRVRRVALGRWRWPALAAVLVYFALSIVLPILTLLLTAVKRSAYMESFSDLLAPGAFDLSVFSQVVNSNLFETVTLNSVGVSIAAAAAGTVLAFLVAYSAYRTRARGANLLEGVSMVPLAIPAIVLGMGLLWTWLFMPVPLYGTLGVLIIAFVAVQMPQGLRSMASAIRATDRDLEDSAVMLGAPRPKAVTYVTVPLMRVAFSSTFLLLLMLSMRELTVPLFLYTSSSNILSIAIFDQFENGGALQQAAALSVIYVGIMFVLSYLPRRFGGQTSV
ncbi:iron ABC transporter permease [Saccharomonospora sp. NPDC046836]|uniref:ABC transporter permease n=1 Tax=Saccharomonospora sp. NPDC046836 TaxID=3156921 RepID=UPI0033BFE14D